MIIIKLDILKMIMQQFLLVLVDAEVVWNWVREGKNLSIFRTALKSVEPLLNNWWSGILFDCTFVIFSLRFIDKKSHFQYVFCGSVNLVILNESTQILIS